MANAVKVQLKQFVAVLAALEAKGVKVNVVKHGSDWKVYKAGSSGSAPCVQLHFGAKNELVGSAWVVNCLVSSGRPHANVNKAGWYGSVQQEIGWSDEQDALKRFEHAVLDISEGRAVALKKGGKGDYAPAAREERKAEQKAEQPEQEEEQPLEQAAATVQ